eukprot:TRINITY_DN3080_c0_g1_i1.p1 TRINITY_DN3080_c0_g1~~TRINITY_DN3080_c0_g1_i1.p1  ORF type:complete len:1199 (+),score=227.85 TRINITY_DN3080_c0_g1_i1:3206-6802(+)
MEKQPFSSSIDHFKDDYHYHSRKKLEDIDHFAYKKPENLITEKQQNRVKQMYARALQSFSQSLLEGSPFQRKTIKIETPIKIENRKLLAMEKLEGNFKNHKSKNVKILAKSGKAKKIIEGNTILGKITKQNDQKDKLDNLFKQLKDLVEDKKQIQQQMPSIISVCKRVETNIKESLDREVYDEAIRGFIILTKMWTRLRLFKRDQAFTLLQMLLRRVPCENFSASENSAKYLVDELCVHLELPDLASDLSSYFSLPRLNVKKHDNPSIYYQLKQMFENLERTEGQTKDERLTFTPDDWQIKLLDVVDAQESALISAPTSSGKTFISFYAMESVLKMDDQSVLIYVSPTKALVNQIEADIYSRFNKRYKNTLQQMYGVFTRDYRKNMDNCQILITVPACLEILLLSHTRKEWVKRIKWIIFDEVHFMGLEGGEVWQRLFLEITCPFLALSATVGNLSAVQKWLSNLAKSHQRKLYVIHHRERYNYLDLKSRSDDGELIPINQLQSLIGHHNHKDIFNLNLLPSECLDAISILESVKSNDISLSRRLEALLPFNFFKEEKEKISKPWEVSWNISMIEMSKYEREVKQIFLDHLEKHSEETINQIKLKYATPPQSQKSKSSLPKRIFDLVEHLSQSNLLPAIVFQMDRSQCEDAANEAYQRLNSKNNTQKLTVQRAHLTEEIKRSTTKKKEIEMQLKKEVNDDLKLQLSNLNDQIEEYSSQKVRLERGHNFFIPGVTRLTEKEIEKVWRKSNDPHLVELLCQGIAIHHSALDKSYRKAVERLFRLKRIGVVFGTTTLSVGISMPCKTVVIYGDSPHLNSINFHQMAGRAGRRGFDTKGVVILAEVSSEKISNLLLNPIPPIETKPPFTPSTILRWNVLYSAEPLRATDIAIRSVRLSKPFKEETTPEHQAFIMGCQFLFSMEYLYKENLIDAKGKPLFWAGSCHHLWFLEPQNFWISVLLRNKMFHLLVSDKTESKIDQQQNLVDVLANIFLRIPLRRKQNSKCILRSLPQPFVKCLEEHDRNLKNQLLDFSNWMFSHLGTSKDRTRLPLSGINLKGCKGRSNITSKIMSFGSDLPLPFSLFSLISMEESDVNLKIGHIVNMLESELEMETMLIPNFERGSSSYNSYISDFFRHGIWKEVIRDNHITKHVAFDNLKQFGLILQVLAIEVERVEEDKSVVELFNAVQFSFKSQFDNFIKPNQ